MQNFRPNRRWLRFSLRTFLIVVTLICIWSAWHVSRTRRQKEAVEAVRAYGGWVYYDYQFDDDPQRPKKVTNESPWPPWLVETFGIDMFHNVVEVNLVYSNDSGKREETRNTSDEIVSTLEGFPDLRRLYLHSTQVTDATMPHISSLKRLEDFFFWDAEQLSDNGVEYLADLYRLRNIHISNSRIGDESLRTFSRLARIERLSLQGNHFSDDGLSHLTKMPRLKSLWIGVRTGNVTDEGLSHLGRIDSLEELDLQGSQISDAGLLHLQRLTNLKHLTLGNDSRITDDGIRLLTTLTNLESLMLVSPAVTSKGFEALSALKKLKHLSIGPNISSKHPLHQALPSCQIMRCTPRGWRE